MAMGPLEGQEISGQEFRVGSRKEVWGLNEQSCFDPVDSVEGTLRVTKSRGLARRRPQLPGCEASTQHSTYCGFCSM